ncbi:MAG TPA: hypothetical protein VNE63_02315 [Candidatus Acidoferrales bacterium]|nr:hypothetical protein [Candidatus Acidoferrales bacterium]
MELAAAKPLKGQRCQVVISLLLLSGLYLPTSVGGDISKSLMAIAYFGVFCLYLYLVWANGSDEDQFLFFSMPIVMVIIGATFLSRVHVFGIGVLWFYVPIALLYSTRLRSLRFGSRCRILFLACNLMNVTLGVSAIFHIEFVNALVISHYSNFFPELVPTMLALGKPIMTFATHSLAAFFLFLFFWLNFRTYLCTRRPLFLIFAICYMVLEPCLVSVSGFGFALLALLVMAIHVWAKKPAVVVAGLVVALLLLPRIAHAVYNPIENWQDLLQVARPAFTAPGEGFLGRYGSQGNNAENLRYVYDHPFSPTGLTTAENLFIGDSGPVEYLLRGSVVLLVLMYVGLFRFLRRNLVRTSDLYVLFVAILAMELGFTSLTYVRMLYLLPVAVIYLNSLERPEADATLQGASGLVPACLLHKVSST